DRKRALEADLQTIAAKKTTAPDVKAIIKRAMDYAGRLAEAFARMDPPALRAVLRDMIDRVEVFFRKVEPGKDQKAGEFLRGLIWLQPGVLPEVSSAACHDHGTSEVSCPPCTSSDRR